MPRRSISERFWSRVDKRGPDECWLWTGARTTYGYGHLVANGAVGKAHRLAWEFANGETAGSMFVCHSCDNPPCVNPAHLWLGTAADNIRDMMAKGRFRSHHAEKACCINGHEFNAENTYPRDGGVHRGCRACDRIRARRYRAQRKAAA